MLYKATQEEKRFPGAGKSATEGIPQKCQGNSHNVYPEYLVQIHEGPVLETLVNLGPY